MNKLGQWVVVGALASSGVLVFACGGGNASSGPANAGSASESAAPQPPPSASAATTASASAAASSAAPMPPAPPLTVVPMKLTVTDASKKPHTVELKADGTLTTNGKTVAKITGAEMDDAGGQPIVSVQGDGTLSIPGQTTSAKAKLDDKDAITVDGNTIISVADDGTVTMADAGKTKLKFSGFKPAARRTAALIVFGTFLEKRSTVAAIGSASVAAPAPAPKKK